MKPNLISIELFGNGGVYSFNYQRYFFTDNFVHVKTRAGINWHPFTARAAGGTFLIAGVGTEFRLTKRLGFTLDVLPALSITYKPIPGNDLERILARENPDAWGQPFENKFQKILGFSSGLHFQINSKYSIGISYTPLMFFDYGLYAENRIFHSGGLMINRHF